MFVPRALKPVLVVFFGTISVAMAAPRGAPDGVIPAPEWTRAIQSSVSASEYHFTPIGTSCFGAPNRAECLRTRVTTHGLEVTPRTEESTWSVALTLLSWGREGAMAPVPPAILSARGNRIELARGEHLVEWYVNDASGLEQGSRSRRHRKTGTTNAIAEFKKAFKD